MAHPDQQPDSGHPDIDTYEPSEREAEVMAKYGHAIQKMVDPACRTCGGEACEEGCGECDYANAGPDSHKVCRSCGGSGVVNG